MVSMRMLAPVPVSSPLSFIIMLGQIGRATRLSSDLSSFYAGLIGHRTLQNIREDDGEHAHVGAGAGEFAFVVHHHAGADRKSNTSLFRSKLLLRRSDRSPDASEYSRGRW